MNLLTHLYLADRTGTSFAGQILGDVVKGRLGERYPDDISAGIRLHRGIDRFSDDHPQHQAMRALFDPPLRRYAGILVDIGFDYSLARAWADYDDLSLPDFATLAEQRACSEWPSAAPYDAARLSGLAQLLAAYREPDGIQRALTSVSRRLSHRNPVADALPCLLAHRDEFDARLEPLLAALLGFTRRQPEVTP